MFPALMITLRSLRPFLLSRRRSLSTRTPQPKLILLNRDELPEQMTRDLGILDGDHSDGALRRVVTRASPLHHAAGMMHFDVRSVKMIHFDVVR